MSKNNWETLGVPPGTSAEDLEKAYKKLVKEHHPDLNPGNEDAATRMKDINAAYTALKKGDTGEEHSQNAPGGPFGFGDIGEMFRQMHRQAFTNVTMQSVFNVPLDMLINGGEYVFIYDRVVIQNSRRVNQPIRKVVTILPNSPIGEPLVFKGEGGHDDPSRPAGDLVLHLRPILDANHRMEDGGHIHVETPIDVFTAMMGGSIEVKAMTGKTVKVNIPPGTPSGKSFRLPNQGLQITKRDRANLFIDVRVDIPAVTDLALVEQITALKNAIYPEKTS